MNHSLLQPPVTGCPCDQCECAREMTVALSDEPLCQCHLVPVSACPYNISTPLFPPPSSLRPVLPTDAAARNDIPMATGALDYFPLAWAEIARCSKLANDQHNPGEPMHWARGKSTEHRDKILKHLTDSGTMDVDGIRHSTKLAWRAMANLQQELEEAGGTPGRASVFPTKR